ncbi:MAG: phosphopentomutase [Verrucomicrobia bacterium]|nr:phosphopentomutase [Verrucomicrobiota bacterium]
MRAYLIVLDSVGIGQAPDAADYGDVGAHTLPHIADALGGLHLPTLTQLGLGCIPPLLPGGGLPIAGVPPVKQPTAAYGAMRERSRGKDTTTGHWEIAGLELTRGLHVFPAGPPSFPPEMLDSLTEASGRRLIGNKAASGTAIIDDLGAEHMQTGALIVYTSADSVFQIAAHESIIPLPELYRACEIARHLCDAFPVGRVIARPFIGEAGTFKRTGNRRDFAFPPPEPTILDRLQVANVHTVTIGKLDDIFAHRGISESRHVTNNARAQEELLNLAHAARDNTFVFANLIDFDMLYGHRRDPAGYAAALVQTDEFLARFLERVPPDDVVIITADHGNDPTFTGSDHTREFVPLLVRHATSAGRNLGVRDGFFDVAQSLAACFGIPALPRGYSFISPLRG